MQINLNFPKWTFPEMTGYKPQTTFWQDFSIADKFGATAIADTFARAFAEWKSNHIYLTELVLVLNHKSWEWFDKKNATISQLYVELYEKAHAYALDNLKDEELSYYIDITD